MHRIQEEVWDAIRAVLSELGLIRSEADMDATMELALGLMQRRITMENSIATVVFASMLSISQALACSGEHTTALIVPSVSTGKL
jgi:hypothetical protein